MSNCGIMVIIVVIVISIISTFSMITIIITIVVMIIIISIDIIITPASVSTAAIQRNQLPYARIIHVYLREERFPEVICSVAPRAALRTSAEDGAVYRVYRRGRFALQLQARASHGTMGCLPACKECCMSSAILGSLVVLSREVCLIAAILVAL